jgi:threonine dehydrogenase-like Zn-dependent dehydrogenase
MTSATAARTATMRAAVVDGPRAASVRSTPVPEPRPGQVLVRIEGCGVCGSNGPVWEGRPWLRYPLAPGEPGHEGWGVDVASGRHVALLSYHAFAEYDVADADAVVELPDALAEMPFPGEAVACAVNVFRRSGIEAGHTVAVVGVGFLGSLVLQLARAAGAEVVAFSRREWARDLARSLGARTPDEARDESCDVVVEVAGVQQTLDLATRLVRVRGRLVIAGYHQDAERRVDMQTWNWRGLDVVNAHERDPAVYVRGMREAVQAVLDGRLEPRPLITHTFPLDRIGDAFEAARTRPDGFLKGVVVP